MTAAEKTAAESIAAEKLGAQWLSSMLAGNFEQAWCVNDRLREMGAEDPHRFWQGEDFSCKRVIVRCLHGFGDSVQLLRYLPQLRKQASKVYVEVAPRFVELATCLAGIDEIITWGPDAPLITPEWDVQMEVMELPYVFRTQIDQLPLAQRYLRIDVPPKGDVTKLQVALSWTAGEWNAARGVPFQALNPILDVGGCDFWNLTAELAPTTPYRVIREDDICRSTLLGLAQRIAASDLVITVDTLAAHLAGAMGVPAWLMLQHETDWRWMSARDDSPWYPSIRIFRQSSNGDWQGVTGRIAEHLCQLVTRKSSDASSQSEARAMAAPESPVRLAC